MIIAVQQKNEYHTPLNRHKLSLIYTTSNTINPSNYTPSHSVVRLLNTAFITHRTYPLFVLKETINSAN